MVARIGPAKPVKHFVREWIEARGLDQKRLAERMGCEPGTVSKLLNDKAKMTTGWLARFAEALNTDIPSLFRHPDRPTPDDLLRNLPEEKRQEVIRVIKAMTGTD